jgi:AcrR family transcriptional regulator
MARSKRLRVRTGRPPKNLAGDVEGRILDAAEKLFLEKGFQSASIDQIAEMAPASKPTIYAHFSGKEALFSAVVARIINGLSDFAGYVPEGRTVQDKLTSLASAIVARGIEDSVGVVRATIAEAQRFPDLSRHVHEVSRNRAVEAVSLLLNDAIQTLPPQSKRVFNPKRQLATAQIFMDFTLLPMLMRALIGDSAKTLREDLPSFVRERVDFFLSACETDWKHQETADISAMKALAIRAGRRR